MTETLEPKITWHQAVEEAERTGSSAWIQAAGVYFVFPLRLLLSVTVRGVCRWHCTNSSRVQLSGEAWQRVKGAR